LVLNYFLRNNFILVHPASRLDLIILGCFGMPKNVAQWTGLAVTTIIVLGCDMDVIYAVPLGIMAGALATLFAALSDGREKAKI
jgi:hypothetical protein